MAPNLQSLPTELIERIANICISLDDQDEFEYKLLNEGVGDERHEKDEKRISNLRSSCRTLEAGTRRVWRKRYFSSRAIYLNPDSLLEFAQIAAVPDLARTIRRLVVWCENDEVNSHRSSKRMHGVARTQLSRAMQSLQSLKKIRLCPLTEDPKRCSAVDHSNAPVFDVTRSFRTTLAAVDMANIRPKAIAVWRSLESGYPPPASGIRDIIILDQSQKEVKHLYLSVLCPSVENSWDTFKAIDAGKNLAAGLNQFIELESLDLFFDKYQDTRFTFQSLAATLFFPRLRMLSLKDLLCRIEDLSAYLKRHFTTLRDCQLSTICFDVDENNNSQPAKSAFRCLLEEVRDTFALHRLRLDRIHLFSEDVLEFRGSRQIRMTDWVNPDDFVIIYTDCRHLLLESKDESGRDFKIDLTEALDSVVWTQHSFP